MENDREKLIDLLTVPCRKHTHCSEDYCKRNREYCKSDIADHLLANGVTFAKDTVVPSKWISVGDELPGIPEGWLENPAPVFFIVKGQDKIEAGYYGEQGTWRDKYFRTYRNSTNGYDADDVLCWMWQSALLEPPKED